MEIIIFGASGRTGQQLTKKCLEQNYQVTAVINHHNPFSDQPNLKIVTCDAVNKDQVEKVITNPKAIIVSVIGHTKLSDKDSQTLAITNISEISLKINLKRIITLTGNGVRIMEDRLSLIDLIMNFST